MDLYNNSDYANPNVNSIDGLLKDGKGQFSTIVSWEAKGMWRYEDDNFTPISILGQLGHNINNKEAYTLIEKNSPYKGQIIYIFEYNDDGSLTLKVFNYDPNKPEKFNEILSGDAWPTKLCPKK